MDTHRTRLGLMVAGMALFLPAASARAQFSLGYDSFVYGVPPAQSFWATEGFSQVYTDPSTGDFSNASGAPYRGSVVPYTPPPFGAFPGSSMPAINARAAVNRAPTRSVAQPQAKRGVLRRLRRR